MRRGAAAAFLLAAVVACQSPGVSRDQWQKMTPREKEAVVQSYGGHRKAVARKGGAETAVPEASAAAWVAEIDRRYSVGETRGVEQVWDEIRQQGGPR